MQIKPAPNSCLAVVLGSPWGSASTSFSILDVLASVGRDWEMLHGHPPRPPVFRALLLSVDGQPYTDTNGRRITPDGAISDCPKPDLVIVPDLHIDPMNPPPAAFARLAAWISASHAGGALIASVCSGAMLIAATGLLDHHEATTHWGYADLLARLHPAVKVRRERILVPSGEGHRIITTGGASAWADLLLYLIGRLHSPEEARRIARIYLLQTHDEGQLCFASLTAGRQHDDKLVSAAQVWAADHYASATPVATMAANSGLSERSFLRRFKKVTGQSPSEYVQTLRIEEAKQMLETTDFPVEAIAAEVGYAEPSSFRHAFRRRVGISATVYRRKWMAVPMHQA